ncbi:MAG: hypothetical protein MI863_09970 [Desulfobacterales bacterium]|nr:hypothetical protein [Desulfobacterales bacterium]
MKAPGVVNLVVFFTSFSILAYEINFTRVFAYAHWHNLSALIITMALLGFGASGSVIAMAQKRIEPDLSGYIRAAVLLFPLSLCTGFMVSAHLDFNPYEMSFSPEQAIYAFVYFALMGIGFFIGAAIICLALMTREIAFTYFTNLAGSAAGVVFVLVISFFMHPYDVMPAVILTALVPAFALVPGEGPGFKAAAGGVLLLIAAALVISASSLNLKQVSQFKPVSGALTLPDAQIVHEAYSPLGVVQVVRADGLRHTAGLSLVSPFQVPVQKAIFFNGEGTSPITPYTGSPGDIGHLKFLAAFLPFHLSGGRAGQHALIIGSGGGESILKATLAGFSRVDALEADKNVITLMKNEFAGFSGGVYGLDGVNIIHREARNFIRSTRNRYDLVELSLVDAYNAAASGMYGLNESYLYTVESVADYLRSLTGNGMLAFTRWTVTPARDNLKLFHTVITALRETGVETPENHLIAIRSLQTLTLVVLKQEATAELTGRARKFAAERLFDMVYYPGMDEAEANRHIRLDAPVYHRGMKALLGDEALSFIRGYEFDIRAATDNRPYFYNFFKPGVIRLIRTFGPSQVPVTEWGYLLLLIILLPVLAVSFLFILLPLVIFKSNRQSKDAFVFLYFSLIGAGFFFVEMPLIQKMTLFLGQPVFALSVILTALLVFSGAGSLMSGAVFSRPAAIPAATAMIAGITCIYTLTLDSLFREFISLEFSSRVGLTILLAAPLGFFMGIPFPAGLALLKKQRTALVPWAWGINGFFSVISIILATLMAVISGFRAVLFTAALLYLAAGLVSLKLANRS